MLDPETVSISDGPKTTKCHLVLKKEYEIHPFDSTTTSISSLEFWASKNDASLFVVGQTTKKRPNGLTFIRMYDGRVLDMIEVGVESWKSMSDFKVQSLRPLSPP